jgi:hypothetical protein
MTQFKNMKFKVESKEHSRKIQEALFDLGYRWRVGGMNVIDTDAHLYAYNDGLIFMSLSKDDYYFDKHENEEATLEYLYKMLGKNQMPKLIAGKHAVDVDGSLGLVLDTKEGPVVWYALKNGFDHLYYRSVLDGVNEVFEIKNGCTQIMNKENLKSIWKKEDPELTRLKEELKEAEKEVDRLKSEINNLK